MGIRQSIAELMNQTGVQFGTSGVRGLAADMTDGVCYCYTAAFLQYLEECGESCPGEAVALGGDLRPSTGRIMRAAARAIADKGYRVEHAGKLSSPALALHGIEEGIPTVMVTGSHIPEDRNGIKYNKKTGEILKADEAGIRRQVVDLPDKLFDGAGRLLEPAALPPLSEAAGERYIRRFLDFFPAGCLQGARIGVYGHSSVSRETMVTVLGRLGAAVTRLGFSERFIPVDTEALRPEDVAAAAEWARQDRFDAIVSTDGDGDRPLIADEAGRWLRGDIAGILCAAYLEADAVVLPVSCNSAVERCGFFERVHRTRIGSPYVIEGMLQAAADGARRVVGYEANGGFMTASPIAKNGRVLPPLPTRDAIIVHLALLMAAREEGGPLSALLEKLPRRFTFSDRLKDFPSETSRRILEGLSTGGLEQDLKRLAALFGPSFGRPAACDRIDGLRVTFEGGDVVHLRPSGNAPEFRCYTEAGTPARAEELNRTCLTLMESWR
ncbi:phosphomannomutase [Desulfatiglans anilini]|uniref:phosphomannomutase n=1 Tax=Desulfatiglans anilini TaxID=90728 RepID=UPI0004218764|nr:phosphomannomutase [Desulfatiglans anilini]